MKLRLKIYLLWFALCGLLAWFAPGQLPPMPDESDEVYWPEGFAFSTQTPKGNEQDPLAIVPVSTKTTTIFSVVPSRLQLSSQFLDISGQYCMSDTNDAGFTNEAAYAYAVDFSVGQPDRKLVWTGSYFTNSIIDGITVYARRVILLSWNQETNQLSEVYWSGDLTNWQSLQHVQYTGQWTFTAADAVTETCRFYKLIIQTP